MTISPPFTWPDRPVGLPPGTRVWNTNRRYGTVLPHEPQYTHGWFPVRWDSWQNIPGRVERCYRFDVTVVTPEMQARGVEIGAKVRRRPGVEIGAAKAS